MVTPTAFVLPTGLGREELPPLPHTFEHRYLGYVTDLTDLVPAYSAVDWLCIAPLDDNFLTTMLAAMAYGTPIVGFSLGGIPEQVTTDCEILVPVKDSDALATALDQALQDREYLQEVGMACRTRAELEYSIETFCERYVSLYKSLLGQEAE
jgi:glycosyltransferase involved in cell wall biosynthesis